MGDYVARRQWRHLWPLKHLWVFKNLAAPWGHEERAEDCFLRHGAQLLLLATWLGKLVGADPATLLEGLLSE